MTGPPCLWHFRAMQMTDDAFLGGKLMILQPKKGFRAGVDSVFLAASLPIKPGDKAVEAGTGPGVAALCLLARLPGIHLTGIEREAASAALARENAARNGMAISVLEADILGENLPAPESFAHGFANPPWFENHTATHSPHALKARAHGLEAGGLERWIVNLGRLVAGGGSLTFIHRWQEAATIAEVMQANHYGAIRIQPIAARQGETPIRAIVRGWKGKQGQVEMRESFVLHEGPSNRFTAQAEAILRHGAGLEF
jgi:tRNA1(Val) A37 N6-methylase TrmN6